MTRGAMTLLPVLALAALGAQAGEPFEPLRPDPRIQTQIEGIVIGLVSAQDRSAAFDAAAELEQRVPDRIELLRQFSFYLAAATSTETSMTGAVIMNALEFSPEEEVEAMVPLLGTPDEKLRKFVEAILASVHRRPSADQGGAPPDFTAYGRYLGPDGPDALADFLIRVSPGEGLAALAEHRIAGAEERAALLASRDEIDAGSEALTALARLAEDPHWWVRRYVAEMLTLSPGLRAPETVVALVHDPHPLVRDAVAGLAVTRADD